MQAENQPTSKKTFQCKMCDASFDTEQELIEHEIKVHKLEPTHKLPLE